MSNNSELQILNKIQIKRSTKFRGDRDAALNYIKAYGDSSNKLDSGEPVLWTYDKGDGTLGAIEVICIYPKNFVTENPDEIDDIKKYIPDTSYTYDGVTLEITENIIKINDDISYNDLQNIKNEFNNTIENIDINGGNEEIWYISSAETADELVASIKSSDPVEMKSDIQLSETLSLDDTCDSAINISDYLLTKSGDGAVIRVNGGKLVIDGNNGHIDGNNNGIENGNNNAIRCSEGGHIIINGGHFTVGDDGIGEGNSVIYCTEGLIEIYGGTFEYTGENVEVGNKFVLNCQNANYNASKANIVVYGGKFMNGYNPAKSYSDENGSEPTNFVAEGYKLIYDEIEKSYTVIKA